MKKSFFYFLTLATLFAAASCEESTTNDVVEPEPKKVVSLLATLENGREWTQGAEVVINNTKYTVPEGEKSTVTFENVPEAEAYYAAYDFGNGTIEGTTLTVEIPAVQGPAISMIQPMVASNTASNLVFKNLLGTLRLAVEGEGTITRLVISSTDTPLAGVGEADLDFSGSPVLTISPEGSRSISVDLGQGVALPAQVDLALPAMIYSGFTVTIYGTGDELMSGASISAVDVRRGEVADAEVTYIPDAEPPTYMTASLENDAEGQANLWSASSVLYVNGTPAQLVGGEGTANGEFGPITSAEKYLVSTSSASANGMSGDAVRVSIPATQRTTASLLSLNPAVGKSSSKEVNLTYLAGLFTVNAQGPHMLRRITLSGKENRRLAGSGVADLATETPRLSLNADASRDVVVDCGTAGVDITAGADFRFVLPAEEYAEGFTLTLEDVNGQTFSTELNAVTIGRNAITAYTETILWENAQGDNNDLSKLGYANCYMVHLAGDYSFKTRKVDNTPVNGIAKVDWLWASKVEGVEGNALISNIAYADGMVTFTASAYEGNVLLAAFDEGNNIVWSWHIWLTDTPEIFDYQNNGIPQSGGLTDGYYCMDRNLGATAAGYDGYENFGLYYQWGRKDPFIGDKTEERTRDVEAGGWMNLVEPFGNSDQLTVCNSAYSQAEWIATPTNSQIGSIEYATAHPMTFLTADPTKSKSNWLNLDTLGEMKEDVIYDPDLSLWRPFQKSNYDPCPAGYQVPRKGMWVALDSYNSVCTDYMGFINTVPDGNQAYYPSAGYRSAHPSDAGALISVQNDTGFVKLWSSELVVAESSGCFSYNDPYFYASQESNWGFGYNVRCVKAY